MGIKVLIFAVVVVLQILCLVGVGNQVQGNDDYGAGVLFFLLAAFFGIVDVAAVIFFLIFVWR
jgi:hypothetical protein